ncbi:MAG: DUF309 domain-containing protein [Thermoplasmatota archaeon]
MNTRRNPNAEPIMDAAASPYLEEGRALFNAGEHWHAHEAWEHLWLGLEGEEKLFAQGLIMGAAMLVQYGKGVQRGVENHYANVRARCQGKSFWGIDGDAYLVQLRPFLDTPGLDPARVQLLRDSQN